MSARSWSVRRFAISRIPMMWPRIDEFVAAAIAGERDSLEREKRYVRKDGSVVWARVRAEVIRDEAGEPLYFVSHLQDVAERRAAQDLLHDSERTLRSVIDNTPAVICVKGRDHRYQLVNREFERVVRRHQRLDRRSQRRGHPARLDARGGPRQGPAGARWRSGAAGRGDGHA